MFATHIKITMKKSPLKIVAEEAQRKLIEEKLLEFKFNKRRVAQHLEIDRKTLYNKMASLGI